MKFLFLLLITFAANAQTSRYFEKDTPAGTIIEVAGSCPSGYLALNGQAVSRTVYNNLFTKIGTNYGVGNGSTTFNVPNRANSTNSNHKFHYITFTGASAQTTDGLLNGHAVGTIYGDAFLTPTVSTNPSLRIKAGTYGAMSCHFSGRCRAGNGSGSTCNLAYTGTNPLMSWSTGTAGSSGTTGTEFSKTVFAPGTYAEREFRLDFTNVTPAASPAHNVRFISCIEIQEENTPSFVKCIKY